MISTGEKRRRALVLLSIITLALPPFLVTNSWLDLLGGSGSLAQMATGDRQHAAGNRLGACAAIMANFSTHDL